MLFASERASCVSDWRAKLVGKLLGQSTWPQRDSWGEDTRLATRSASSMMQARCQMRRSSTTTSGAWLACTLR
jgi:hypothetical protein